MKELRIGVYVCWCGTNISKMVDVENASELAKDLPGVVVSKDYKYMCSDPGQETIINDIKEHDLNRIVVAACSPRIHEATFRKAIEKAGLNQYMLEIANIREHVSWVHTDKERASQKAHALIAAAVTRVKYHESLEKRYVDINPASLVMGGGISGMSAALLLAEAGKQVYLAEKEGSLGGITKELDLTFPYLHNARQLISELEYKVLNHDKIEVLFNTEIKDISGYVGNFETQLNGGNKEIKFGHIVVATGLKPFDASRIPDYGYGKLPDVVTAIEFEAMLQSGNIFTTSGEEPKKIAVIHCVGSRNELYNEYCSRTCCLTALKYVNQIKSAIPDADVFDIYADLRSFGKGCEELYNTTAALEKVVFLNYDQRGELPIITETNNKDYKLSINFREQLSNVDVEVPADLVILMTGMSAQDDAKKVSHAAGVSLCGNDFFIEKHPKLDPVATTTDGVFIVGSCQGPKDIPDSISQARAAVARILATLATGTKAVEVTTAQVNEEMCCGCQTCIAVCPYTAISFIEEKKVSEVNEILCKGCGTCGSTCPTGAITSKHFTDQQILSQIEGLLKKEKEEIV